MGKKFKFGNEAAARPDEGSNSSNSSTSSPFGFEDESAGLYDSLSNWNAPALRSDEAAAPARDGDVEKMSKEINKRLAPTDESAARFTQKNFNMGEISHSDAGYLKMLSDQTGYRIVNLAEVPKPSSEIVHMLTAEQAKRLTAVPVAINDLGQLMIAVGDPSNTTITDDLTAIIEFTGGIEIVIAPTSEINERIDSLYGVGDTTLEDILKQDEGGKEVTHVHQTNEVDLSDMDAISVQPRVIKFVNLLLIKAIKERASDIHIEPFPNVIRIRYRVDGVLREIPSPPADMRLGIVARLKVLAGMDIAEMRLPQDGRIKLSLEGREIDLRVSTMPTAHGEAIVMRVLDKNMMMIGISQIGMTDEMLTKFKKHIKKPNGIVLVTGPTGSGKTTTLYAGIAEIKDPGEKLITVEDPVEYEVGGIVQVNINDGIGLTFARCLRAILRQDPDTILVGEIRDSETAQIAVQASLTGHLVFSTLHTNSAAGTITRLIDMGVQPFLITSSVEAVIGQRLVRSICPACREPYTPTFDELAEFGLDASMVREIQFFHGRGCSDCTHTGYKGRMGLFELLEVNDEIRDLIIDQAGTDEIHEAARRNGLKTMREDGWFKICLGLTTFEEVLREAPRDSEEELPDAPGAKPEDEGGAGDHARLNSPTDQPGGAVAGIPGVMPGAEAAARVSHKH